jgi:hypothetical protein
MLNTKKNITDEKDKELLKLFHNKIKIFQKNSQNYMFGFSDKNTYEIIRIKGNISFISSVLNKFNKVIINVPIRDYDIEKVINGLIKKNKICDKNIEKIYITNEYFLTNYTNNLEMVQLHLNNNTCNRNISSIKNIAKKIKKKNHNTLCSITCFFDKKTIKKLKSFLNKKYKNETGGIFKINNINHEILGNIYQVKMDSHQKGDQEDVDVISSSYNFHTHPYTAYINHNCDLGWPSLDDLKTYLFSFISYKTFFHAVSTLEGIYIISVHPECLHKIKVLKDIPIHLEKWIDKHLHLSKENVKLPEGKYIKNFGYINNGEQFVKYMATKKYPKWKCNIFSMTFLPWEILDKNVYTCFSIHYPKIKGKCNIKKI